MRAACRRRRVGEQQREIKGHAGGSEHCAVADEREHATGNGAGSSSPTGTGAADSPSRRSTAAGQPGLPQAPAPKLTEPLYLRDTGMDYTKPQAISGIRLQPYTPTNVPLPRLGNTPRLDSLLRDGKIYLSLSDAVLLALENNFDIAIARINLDIADTDILRAKAGATSARRFDRPGDEYAGRIDDDDYRRRRSGRHLERSGRRRRGRGRTGAEHEWRRPDAGDSGPGADGNAAVRGARRSSSRTRCSAAANRC